jgi:hypothetical protein
VQLDHTPEHTPTLEFVARVRVDLDAPMDLGDVPIGRRKIIPILGGSIEGPALQAEILTGGADWQIVGNDGTAVIDTRYTARTPDGSLMYLATQGFRHGPADVLERVAAGEPVGRDEYYFRLTVRLETGSAELAWINRTVFVASAGREAMTVRYDLFALR